MPGHQDAWRGEADGSVAAEVGAYRLLVRSPEDACGAVRFLVPRRSEGDDRQPALVGSGTEADLRTARAKAARMADRLVGLRPEAVRRAV